MAFIRVGGFRVALVLASAAAFAAGIIGAGLYLSLVRDLPDLKTVEDYRPPLTTRVLDRNGRPIGEFSSERRRLAARRRSLDARVGRVARIAEQRGTTMLEVVTDAVHRLGRDEWWSSVRDALDGLTSSEVASYQVESQQLDAAASADGLDER